MAASNSGGFSWTEEKSSIILDIMTHLVISKKLDPLADDTIEMVLSKVVEFKDFTLFRGITTQDVHISVTLFLNYMLGLPRGHGVD